jgi:hypothetical protein
VSCVSDLYTREAAKYTAEFIHTHAATLTASRATVPPAVSIKSVTAAAWLTAASACSASSAACAARAAAASRLSSSSSSSPLRAAACQILPLPIYRATWFGIQ